MTDNRLLAVWLRSLAGLVALAGLLALGASARQRRPTASSTPGTLAVTPSVGVVAYSGIPISLTVSGGTPYKAFSSDAAVLPVNQAVSGSTIPLVASRSAPIHP
jgi:hypothetical protein